MRDDEQKPHIRLSPWVSWHNITKPTGSGGRVNAAFVHEKFTFLSGEICASRDKEVHERNPEKVYRLTNDPAYPLAVSRYESHKRETRNKQQLMRNLIAPFMATCGVSTQKSADGIVLPGNRREGPNVEMSEAIS